jgi:hypothetical protein
MRIANYEGRLVVVTGGKGHEIAHDVEKNSGGRFGPEPQAIYEDWGRPHQSYRRHRRDAAPLRRRAALGSASR